MALTEIPKELSSTPSIVDGGNATAITIDSSENIGIGTGSPTRALSVFGNTAGVISITSNSTDGISSLSFGDTADDNAGRVNYLNASDAMAFYTAASERMRILPTGGITFNGDTAQANALDDYEEGAWTPTVAGCSINVARASYTKIGNLVTVNFNFLVTATDGSTDPVSIAGRPFVGSSANAESNGSLMIQYVTTVANTINLSLYTYSRHGTMEIYQSRSNNGVWVRLNRSQLNANSTAFIGSMTYETDT